MPKLLDRPSVSQLEAGPVAGTLGAASDLRPLTQHEIDVQRRAAREAYLAGSREHAFTLRGYRARLVYETDWSPRFTEPGLWRRFLTHPGSDHEESLGFALGGYVSDEVEEMLQTIDREIGARRRGWVSAAQEQAAGRMIRTGLSLDSDDQDDAGAQRQHGFAHPQAAAAAAWRRICPDRAERLRIGSEIVSEMRQEEVVLTTFCELTDGEARLLCEVAADEAVTDRLDELAEEEEEIEEEIEEADAYSEGWDAWINGRSISECPYGRFDERNEPWKQGWKGASEVDEAERGPTRVVEIPARPQHEGFYRVTVRVRWACPVCGGPRGDIYRTHSYDGSRRMSVDGWQNACGHVDKYADVVAEAKANGLNVLPEAL